MTQAARNLSIDPPPPADAEPAVVTPFGALAYEPDRVITFPQGLLGFADRRRYVLSEVPGATVFFKLLQSIDDPELSFVVLPLDRQGGPIATADLEAACANLAFDWDASAVLAIVTLRPEAGRIEFTANLRAPLVIDTNRRLGCQHVLADEVYPLRHPLPRPGEDAS